MANWWDSFPDAPQNVGKSESRKVGNWWDSYPDAPVSHDRFSQGTPGSGGRPRPTAEQQALPDTFAGKSLEGLREIPGDVYRGAKETISDIGQGYAEGAAGHVGPAQVLYGGIGAAKGAAGSPAAQAGFDVGMSGYLPVGKRGLENEPVRSVGRDLPADEGRSGVPEDTSGGRVAPPEVRENVSQKVGPSLTSAIRHNGKLYKADPGGTHLDALSKVGKDQREEATLDGNSRVFVTENGRILDRSRAQDYAVKHDLFAPNAPAWVRTAPELTDEVLARPQSQATATGKPAEGGPASAALPTSPPRLRGNLSTPARVRGAAYRAGHDEGIRRVEQAFADAGLPKPGPDQNAVVSAASGLLREGKFDDPWDAYEAAERQVAEQDEHLASIGVPRGEVERQTNPFGVGAAPAAKTNAAAQAAAWVPGKVNRFTALRPLENIFDRLRGARSAKRVEVRNDIEKYKDAPQELREKTFRYGEGDKEVTLTPEEEQFFDEHVQPSRERGQSLWKEVNTIKNRLGISGDLLEEIEDMKPGYMHRRTIKSARQLLGLDEADPVTGFNPQYGGSTAPQTKPRKYFALDDGNGGRRVVYIDQGRMYLASKTYPQGVLVKERIRGDFVAKKGSRLFMNGREWRVADALTREIEDVGGPEYVKDSIAATRLSELELTRMRDTLLAQEEGQKFLLDNGFASRTNNPPGTEWWVKTNAPGFQNLYMPPRIAKVIEARSPKLTGDEDPWQALNRVSHAMVTTLFWNPVFHAANVSAHAFIERGFRNFNPAADVRYVGYFRKAWNDVATQNASYQRSLKEGAALMLGPRRANRELTHLMFDGIKELQESSQGVNLLQRLGKLMDVKPFSFVRGYYRWAGDALWQAGDVLTQAAIYDRQAAHHGEALKDTISRVHREIPSYRSPVEQVLPGKAGRTIGGIQKSAASRTVINFAPYHENILRGLVLIGEDIIQGVKHAKTPEARAGAMEALGKIAAISSAMAVYRFGLDPIAKQLAGDDQQAKRFGPFSYLQTVLDYSEAKHFSAGAKTRLFTGGFYSPSPLVEMGTNAFGYQAFSMSPIQPKDKAQPLREFGGQVPWLDRVKQIASSSLPPFSQARDIGADPAGGILRALGPTQFKRKTEEEQKVASKERKAAPEYRSYKSAHPRGKRARHEDSLPPSYSIGGQR